MIKHIILFALTAAVLAGCDDVTQPVAMDPGVPPPPLADGGVVMASSHDDTEPPQLVDLVFEPASIDVTEQNQVVTFTWTLTDDLSGVATCDEPFSPTQLRITSPSGQQSHDTVVCSFNRISGTQNDGVFVVEIDFPRFIEAGMWTITSVLLVDAVGNSQTLATADLQALGISAELDVTSIPDVTPPELVDLVLEPLTIDVTEQEQQVTVRWTLTDDLSGAATCNEPFSPTQLRIISPSGQQSHDTVVCSFDRVSGTQNDGVFETVITFPQFAEAGVWLIQQVFLVDALGNSQLLTTAELESRGITPELTVESPSDVSAPELVDIGFEPTTVNTAEQDQVVTFTWTLTDDLSGVATCDEPASPTQLRMVSPSGQQFVDALVCSFNRTSGTQNDGVFVTPVTFPQFSEIGTWKIQLVFLTDAVGNSNFLSTEELEARGLPTELEVRGAPSPNQPPTAAAGPDQTVEWTSDGVSVTLDGTGSSDPDGDVLSFSWTDATNVEVGTGSTPTIDLGSLGSHTITLTVDDGQATHTDQVTITVVDTTPPDITLSVDPSELWPPNHKYVTVSLSVAVSDACDPNPVVTAVVKSSEPDDATGNGDGHTTGDIRVTTSGGPMVLSSNESPQVMFDPVNDQLEVRAERAGSGHGRTYTIVVTATDASGNVSTETVTVTVPHDRR